MVYNYRILIKILIDNFAKLYDPLNPQYFQRYFLKSDNPAFL